MNEFEICQSIINQVKLIQNECCDLIVNTTKIVESHSAILEVCRNNYKKVESLQNICQVLLDQVEHILGKTKEPDETESFDLFPEPAKSESDFLPATTKFSKNYLSNDIVEAALRCLKQLHIVGMSKETILVWPFGEAPKAIQEMAFAAGLPNATWAAVLPAQTKYWSSATPLKPGFSLRFSTGHEVIYGTE